MRKHIKLFLLYTLAAAMLLPSFTLPTGAAEVDALVFVFDTKRTMLTNKNALHVYTEGNDHGKYEVVTEGEGAPYLKFFFEENETYAKYRCAPRFTIQTSPEYCYVRVKYRTTDPLAAKINLAYTSSRINLVPNTALSQGEWVVSDPVKIFGNILDRLHSLRNVVLEYTGTGTDSDLHIKELTFFKSEADAYNYYGDEPSGAAKDPFSITFGFSGNARFDTSSALTGNYTVGDDDITLTYADKLNRANTHYSARFGFLKNVPYDRSYNYIRVLYSAKNPAGDENVSFVVDNNGKGKQIILESKVKDTDGYVLSPTMPVHEDITLRFYNYSYMSFSFTAKNPGGEYKIKEVYLFASKEDADAFDSIGGNTAVTLGKNPIEKYSIVISGDAAPEQKNAALELQKYIISVSGKTIPIVTDDTPEGECEIMVGLSMREKSSEYLSTLENVSHDSFVIETDDNSLVISSVIPSSLDVALDTFLSTYMYKGNINLPDEIKIASGIKENARSQALHTADSYYTVKKNAAEPETIYEDFDADDGYFTEENGADAWRYSNGKYTVNAVGETLSYIHVYESNVYQFATLKATGAKGNSDMGLICRYAAADAYIKAGYDFSRGEWYIEYREGTDYYLVRAAAKKATITEGRNYRLCLVANGNDISLTVDGKWILSATTPHVTPGRVGIFAKDIALSTEDFKIHLLSGEGTVFKNVEHNILPDEIYREGGSVVELNNGTLQYQEHRGSAFASTDNGTTWTRTENFTQNFGYLTVLRLNNGDLMQIAKKTVNGVEYYYSRTSSNDGKTWVDGGILTATVHAEIGVGSSHMNDKLTELPSIGRIFFPVEYYSKNHNGKRVCFTEFYYTDDLGKTWHRSETLSNMIRGIEDDLYFSEIKILECDDGTVRLYCSHNYFGNIMYADSKDGGVTFGPLKKLEGAVHCTLSSMQFVRDPYGPTDTSYFMVYLPRDEDMPSTRSRLSLAYSTDGKTWSFIGDIWRYEHRYKKDAEGLTIAQIVDPFIQVTKDYIICGSGISEKIADTYHNAQRQHIWTIRRDTLPEGTEIK